MTFSGTHHRCRCWATTARAARRVRRPRRRRAASSTSAAFRPRSTAAPPKRRSRSTWPATACCSTTRATKSPTASTASTTVSARHFCFVCFFLCVFFYNPWTIGWLCRRWNAFETNPLDSVLKCQLLSNSVDEGNCFIFHITGLYKLKMNECCDWTLRRVSFGG